MKNSKYAYFTVCAITAALIMVGCNENSSSDTSECTSNEQCANRTDGKTLCNMVHFVCVSPQNGPETKECTSHEQCANRADGKTQCDLNNLVCIIPQNGPETKECTSNEQCANRADGKTQCDLNNFVCIIPQSGPETKECTSDEQCANRTDGKTECDQINNICIPPQSSETTKCGNELIEENEDCEIDDLNGQSCTNIGEYVAGNLKCDAVSCSFDASDCMQCTDDNTTLCDAGDICQNGICTKPVVECGNNVVESPEECDQTNLNDKTCLSWPDEFVDGKLTCNNGCTFDKSNCVECTPTNLDLCKSNQICKNGNCVDPDYVPKCGNDIIDENEDCESSKPLNKSCADFAGAGELKCTECKYDDSSCVECTEDIHCSKKGDKTKCQSNICVKPANVVIPKVVISQIYPGGGNSGAIYNTKYIELLNIDDNEADISNWSIQYGSASSTAVDKTICELPNDTKLPKGGYYLIALSTGTNGDNIPTADYVCPKAVKPAADKGKLFLVSEKTALTSSKPESGYVDAVGYGTATNWAEGGNPTANLKAAKAALRKNGGCIDTDNNGNDFEIDAPSPRNSKSPINLCEPSQCGNNKIEYGEDCDGEKFKDNKKTCAEWNSSYNKGNVSCNECKIDYNSCSYEPPVKCGNSQLDDDEDCDGTKFKDNKKTCAEWNSSYNKGNVSCNNCQIDYKNCSYEAPPECSNGNVMCSEKDFALKRCVDGKWVMEQCPSDKPYCFSGEKACRMPVDGEKCVIDNFIPFTVDEYVIDCNVFGTEIGTMSDPDENGVFYSWISIRPCEGECKTAKEGWGVNENNAAECTASQKGMTSLRSSDFDFYENSKMYACCVCKQAQDNQYYWLMVPATYQWKEWLIGGYYVDSCTPWPEE